VRHANDAAATLRLSREYPTTGKPAMKFYAADLDRFLKTAVTAMFVAITLDAFGVGAWGQGGVKTKFDAWELRCDTPVVEKLIPNVVRSDRRGPLQHYERQQWQRFIGS
jgi:hypothetical protein